MHRKLRHKLMPIFKDPRTNKAKCHAGNSTFFCCPSPVQPSKERYDKGREHHADSHPDEPCKHLRRIDCKQERSYCCHNDGNLTHLENFSVCCTGFEAVPVNIPENIVPTVSRRRSVVDITAARAIAAKMLAPHKDILDSLCFFRSLRVFQINSEIEIKLKVIELRTSYQTVFMLFEYSLSDRKVIEFQDYYCPFLVFHYKAVTVLHI
jgi:hypothetical protein